MKKVCVKVILYFCIVFSELFVFSGENLSQTTDTTNYKEAIAAVLEIYANYKNNSSGFSQTTQKVKIKVLDGDLKDKIFQ